jgi:para-nitrobenzyl esterase
MAWKTVLTASALALGLVIAAAAPGMSQQTPAPAPVRVDSSSAPPMGPAPSPSGPVLSLKQGKVQGFQREDVLSLLGIPYAPPPVGDLRWKEPGKPPSWTGVKQAVAPGPICGRPDPHEDCLYLNVYTAANFKPNDKRAIMVWIHGGSFVGGASHGGYGVLHDGLNLAKQGVVVVAINYRLGRAGWFSDPAINAEPGLHNNYGMMDMLAAIRWAKDNATSFGGDPGNITIFGESAGGGSIYQLMRAPQSKGLVQKAIAESSFPRSMPVRIDAALAYGESIEKANNITGTPAERAAALRALPLSALDKGQGPNPYPIEDGQLIFDGHAVDAYAAGRELMIPFMVGGNSADVLGGNFSAAAFDAMTDRKESFTAAYDPANALNKPLMMSQRQTDLGNTEPNFSLATAHAKNGQPSYLYFFDYVPAAQRSNPGVYGARHGAEIQYVFGTGDMNAEGQALSKAMTGYWAAFAKYGDPGKSGGPAWPSIGAKDEPTMVFSPSGAQAVPHFLKARIDWILAGVAASSARPRP